MLSHDGGKVERIEVRGVQNVSGSCVYPTVLTYAGTGSHQLPETGNDTLPIRLAVNSQVPIHGFRGVGSLTADFDRAQKVVVNHFRTHESRLVSELSGQANRDTVRNALRRSQEPVVLRWLYRPELSTVYDSY
jgi:hypothetical protein